MATAAINRLNLQDFLNDRPVGAFQWRVGLLAFIVLLLDGFDIVAIGFIIPSLIDAWHVSRQALGPTLVAALIGLAIGAMAGGPIADRIGRRKVIIGSILFFGVMSFASAFSTGLTMLTILRFLTGLGLGASQPNTGTLISEYAPYRHRSIFVTLTYCGFTVGAALGGFLSAALLATYGWPSILIVGGVVPMLIALLCVFLLPESPRFLTLHPSRHAALCKIVNAMAPGTADANTQFVTNEVVTGQVPFAQIVSRPYVATTLLLWMGIFSTMFTVYLMNSWLPTLIKGVGFSIRDAALIGAMGQVGGVTGNIFIGWAMDKWESHRVVWTVLLVGAVCAIAIGTATMGVTVGLGILTALIFALGLTTNCTNTTWVPLATNYYPTEMRATGTGTMTGAGRIGAISGASMGAVLLSWHFSMGQIFYFLCVPIFIGIVAAYSMERLAKTHPDATTIAAEPTLAH